MMRQPPCVAIAIVWAIAAGEIAAQPGGATGTDSPTAASVAVVGHPDPLALLADDDPVLARNKRLVFDMWRSIVNGGHVELADEMLLEDYTQHSPVLPTGRAAFRQIFSAVPRLNEIPDLVQPPLIALVAEGDFVVMAMAEAVPGPADSGSYTTTHFNLFRIENGRLAEHWHSVQTPPGADVATPEDGGPQPVFGVVGTDQYALLDAAEPVLAGNKRLVFDAWRQIVAAGRNELADLYLADAFVDHGVLAGSGPEAIAAPYAVAEEGPIDIALDAPLVAMVAEGDLVVQVLGQNHPHPARAGATYTTTWFDMFRVADGRLTEHWDPSLITADTAGSSPGSCAPEGNLDYICGLANAEDLVRIGASGWLVASSITTRGEAVGAGRLYLVDAAARTASEFFPAVNPTLRRDVSMFGDCAIDLAAFDTHGLAISQTGPRRYRLYSTSHGTREAIQIFEIETGTTPPSIAWVGCVPLPDGVWANSVAILDDGGFVTTQFYDPTDPDGIAILLAGGVTGRVFEWHPGGRVNAVPGTELSGPNGIELSADERFLYVASFGGRGVVRFERGPDPASPVSIPLDISADNLRWTEQGTLLTVGSNADAGTGWSVYEIDPATLTALVLVRADGDTELQGASTALRVDDELFVGTPGGNRIGVMAAP